MPTAAASGVTPMWENSVMIATLEQIEKKF